MRHRALALVVALTLGGCSYDFAANRTAANQCASDEDCASGSCDRELRVCVAASSQLTGVAIEVASAASASGATMFATDAEANIGIQGELLVVHDPTKIFGTVRRASGASVQAEITFVAAPAFLGGRETRVTTTTAAVPFAVPMFGARAVDWSADVPSSTSYAVYVTPRAADAEDLPPIVLEDTRVAAARGTSLDVVFDEASFTTLNGFVTTERGAPQATLQVQAIDPVTGRVVSSTPTLPRGTYESANIPFSLRIDPDYASRFLLRVRSLTDEGYPTFLVDTRYLLPDRDGMVRILVPEVSDGICYRGSIELAGEGGAPLPASGARISLKATLDSSTGASGQLELDATADALGRFEVRLLPGDYEAVVTPVGDIDAGTLHENLHITRNAGSTSCIMGQVFSLPRRARVRGIARNELGVAVRDATVQALALHRDVASSAEGTAPRFNRSTESVCDRSGAFAVAVDVGAYDLVVKPTEDSGLPWLVMRDRVFAEPGAVHEEDATIPLPIVHRGRVVDEEGNGVVGAEVTAFGLVRGMTGAPRAINLGRATSSDDGSFVLLLPPSF